MPYSLEVHFDDHTNTTIQDIWKVLSKNKIPCRALEKNFSPHITLVYGEITGAKKVNWDFLENQKSFKFEFNAFAAFPDRGVLFLSPEQSNSLSELHKLHDAHAEFSSMNKFYRTDLWEPHCSLASRLSEKQLGKCVRLFEDFTFPIKATCVSSNFVKYPQAEVLSSFQYLPE